jgi:hypothetical protein
MISSTMRTAVVPTGRSRWFLVAAVVGALAVACCAASRAFAADAPRPAETPTAEQIRDGFAALRTRIFAFYPVPYRFHSGVEWQRQFAAADAAADKMTPAEVFVEVARFMGMLRDAHSWASIDNGARLMSRAVPLRFWKFDDGVYVRAARSDLAQLVGARLTAVDGVAIDEVIDRMIDVQPGTNASLALNTAQIYLTFPEYLQALGIARDDSSVSLTLTMPGGETSTKVVPVAQYQDYSAAYSSAQRFQTPEGWVEPSAARTAPWLAQRGRPFWYYADPRHHAIVLQINEGVLDPAHPYDFEKDEYTPYIAGMFDLIEKQHIDRLIIDLRHNSGGDSRMYDPLVRGIIRSRALDLPGHTLVLTSRLTESAAVAWCARLEGETSALFLGELTASPPNYYNDPAGFRRESFHIPGTPINYRIARVLDVWSAASTDDRLGMAPDFPVGMTWADFASGRDPILERALSLDPGTARTFFLTRSGEDTAAYPYLHYQRKSQDSARLTIF